MAAIRRWTLATFILTFLVIIAGGVVRTTQSGMGCPDWPKCFGQWIPPMNESQLPPDFEKYLEKQDIDHTFNALHTWIEYINRLVGALLGLFAVIQAALLFNKRKQYRTPFRLALGFLLLVVLTGLFGAIVVKLNLAHLSISVHLFFAIALLQIQLALILSLKEKTGVLPLERKLRSMLLAFLFILIVQSVLGTMVRIYVDDVSKALGYQQRDTWLAALPLNFLLHRSFSWVVLLLSLLLAWQVRQMGDIKNKVWTMTAFVILNMIVGIVLFYAGMPAVAQPLHLVMAAAAITQTISVLLQTKPVRNNITI